MESVIQRDRSRCFICGRRDEALDKHHVFGGALRNKSEKYGAFIWICHNRCHIFGENSVHQNAVLARKIKQATQLSLMGKYGWSIDDFRKEFYKSYD